MVSSPHMDPERLGRQFPGNSHIAKLLRQIDWSSNDLGSPETWSHSLQTAIANSLAAPTPMFVWWGPSRVFVYNDASIQLLHGRHPSALARSGRDAWSDDVWAVLGPTIERVFTSGETEWCENLRMLVPRQIASEETYVTIALAPILDDRGTIEGVAGACLDVTAKVIADRRLALLHKIGVGLATVRSIDVAAKTLAHVLRDSVDVPFAVIYTVEADEAQARAWLSTSAEDADLPTIADRASLLGPVLETEEVAEIEIDDMTNHRALALPIRNRDDVFAGILVCGLNPLAPLDASYRSFLELIAANIGATLAVAEPPQLRPADVAPATNDAFLSVLGHELRNPLGALMTTLQTMMLRAPSLEVELMERSVRTLTRMVDNVLDVSRIARGGLDLQPKPTELATIVDRAMQLATPLFTERNTQVFVQIPRSGLRFDVDPERIAQAIAGLLSNASRYSEPGSRVWVQAAREYDRVRLIVKDEGKGIEPDRLGEIFNAAHMTSEKRPRNAGLGLGLVIARSLVELHGGSLHVTSSGTGRGTEAVIELPIDTRVVTKGPVANAPASRRRLLLVEDNDDAARSLKNALELLGYVVALAHNGPIALNVARAFDPDVVLLDIGLPVMDGWELAKRLRELSGATHDAPVVAVTAYDRDIDRQRSTEAGFADHLVKPIDLGKLQEVVESLPLRSPPSS